MMYQMTLALLFGALALSSPASAQSSEHDDGEIVELKISAPSLEGNLIGTPVEQYIQVYLPPGYESSTKRYPVLYLLHGMHGTDRTWLRDVDAPERQRSKDSGYQDAGFVTADALDARFLDDGVPEMIIVAPNGRNKFKHSFWLNGEVTGDWTDFVVEDVIGYVDANFRTLAQRESRGIGGHSGGGHGSIRIAMQHPETFNAVYAMAPCCLGPDQSSHAMSMTWDESGELGEMASNVFATVEKLRSADDLPGSTGANPHDFNVNLEVAMAAVFSPNPEKAPFYSDFAFVREDGRLHADPSIAERRRAQYAYHVLDDHAGALRNLNGFMIDTGELEMTELREGAAAFVEKLAEHQVPVRFEVYAKGNHGNLFAPRFITLGLDFFAQHLAIEPIAADE